MSGKNELLDTMIPFFGLKDDKRIRLYLDALAEDFFYKNSKIQFSNNNGPSLLYPSISPQLKNKFFQPIDQSRGDDDIHFEWEDFRANLQDRLSNKNQKNFNDPTTLNNKNDVSPNEVISIIQQSQGLLALGVKLYIQEVIKAHLFDLVDAQLNDPSTWGSATGFTFRVNFNHIFAPVFDLTKGNASPNSIPKSKIFSFNLSKFVISELMERGTNTNSLGTDNFWTNENSVVDKYFRIQSDPKKIFTTDNKGNKIDVSRTSSNFKKLGEDKCIGTKVKEVNDSDPNKELKCSEYIQKCINEGKPSDIRACKKFMEHPDFWTNIQSEVNEMLPGIITDTLDSFGFQISRKNKKYLTYESVGSWLKNLQSRIPLTQLTQAEFNNISNNFKLKQYLEMLVAKINGNPAIINENYFESKNFDDKDYSSHFVGWTPYGLKPRYIFKSSLSTDMARQFAFISNGLNRMRSSAQRRIVYVPGNGILLNGNPFKIGGTPYFMRGGRAPMLDNNEDFYFAKQSDIIENLLNTLKHKINLFGKNLDADTLRNIDTYLKQYKDSENKLMKAIKYTDRYIDLIEIYQEYDNSHILSVDHLKSFVEARDKYFNKTENRQNTLLNVLQSISDSVLDTMNEDDFTKREINHTRNN